MAVTNYYFGSFKGLADIRASIVDRIGLLRGFERKAMTRAAKEAGYKTLEYWHANYARKHFERGAVWEYTPYNKYYSSVRKGGYTRKHTPTLDSAIVETVERKPLVETGHLRTAVVDAKLVRGRNLTGTSKRTTLKLRFGRPKETFENAQKEIAHLIDKYGMSRKAAQRKAFAHAGYSPAVKQRFQELIPFTSEREKKVLINVFKREFLTALHKIHEVARRKGELPEEGDDAR